MQTEIYTLKFEAGKKIGAYTLLTPCGEGAYGKVFLAENTLTKQQVALKVVWGCGRELKGITAYQTICRQTNLLQIWHVEAAEDFFYYTMDPADDLAEPGAPYLPDTLANRLKKYGKLPPEQVRRMAQEVMESLRILHGMGMVHRDIKPENILWIRGRAVPGDVGLVSADARATLAGTPGFMPPEVLAGIASTGRAALISMAMSRAFSMASLALPGWTETPVMSIFTPAALKFSYSISPSGPPSMV